jgi:hypothetical protein
MTGYFESPRNKSIKRKMILGTSDSSHVKYIREWADINTNGALKFRGSWVEPYIMMTAVTQVICFNKYLVRNRKLF